MRADSGLALLYCLFPAGLVQDVFIKRVSSSPHEYARKAGGEVVVQKWNSL